MPARNRDDYLGDPPLIVDVYNRLPRRLKAAIEEVYSYIGAKPYVELLANSPLRQRGWFKSAYNVPIDENDNPLPWAPYSFIDFVGERLNDSIRVFEFGSGYSTEWYAIRTDEVIAVEHDEDWFNEVKGSLPDNAQVILRNKDEYANAIEDYGTFDIVVIDGLDRVNCARAAISYLSSSGVIIWDDTYNRNYEEGFEILFEDGYQELFFQGMGPVTANLQRTSIFYKYDNCLSI